MLKKLVIAAAAVVVGLVVLKKTDLGSLMQVWWKDATACAARQVSPETRIKQCKMEIAKIDDDIKVARNNLIQHALAHRDLKEAVETLKTEQIQRKADMKVLIEGLEKEKTRVAFKGDDMSTERAQVKLDSLRGQYEAGKEALKVREQLLKSKTEQVELLKQRITKIKDKQGELTDVVAKLEAQLELVRLKQLDKGTLEVNDSKVSECVQLTKNLRKMIAEEELKADLNAELGLTPGNLDTAKDKGPSRSETLKAAKAALGEEPENVLTKE
jgi:chromosome segregation ATPase